MAAHIREGGGREGRGGGSGMHHVFFQLAVDKMRLQKLLSKLQLLSITF